MNSWKSYRWCLATKSSKLPAASLPAISCSVLPALFAACTGAQAQSVLVPSADVQDRTPSMESAAANQVGSVGLPTLRRPSEAQVYPLRWGAVQFHPHLGYQVSYGDGILQGTNSVEKTAIQSIAPGMFLEVGHHWALDGAVTFNEYSNPVFKDNIGYFLGVKGLVPREQWVLNFGYTSSLTEETQVETAQQDTLNTHVLGVSATRQFENRLSLELGASQDIRLSKHQSDYATWSSINWLDYHATPKTAVGVGLGAGYNLIDPGTDWFFERITGRVLWQPGTKLNVQVSGGGQFVQFSDSDVSSDLFPVVNASLSWQIFTTTFLTAGAGHGVENTLEANQIVEHTGVNVGLRQRFFGHFYLDVSPGFSRRSYQSSSASTTTNRKDDYFTVQTQLSTVLFRKLHTAAFYQFADNDSTESGFGFQSHQVGLRLDYRY